MMRASRALEVPPEVEDGGLAHPDALNRAPHLQTDTAVEAVSYPPERDTLQAEVTNNLYVRVSAV